MALAVILAVAGIGNSPNRPAQADQGPAVAAAAIGLILAGTCVQLGRAQSSRGRAAALMGVALGAVYAATAGLLKALTDIALRGPSAVIASWQLYTVVLLGAFSLLLTQLTFQAGPLTASLPAASTVDPLSEHRHRSHRLRRASQSRPGLGCGPRRAPAHTRHRNPATQPRRSRTSVAPRIVVQGSVEVSARRLDPQLPRWSIVMGPRPWESRSVLIMGRTREPTILGNCRYGARRQSMRCRFASRAIGPRTIRQSVGS